MICLVVDIYYFGMKFVYVFFCYQFIREYIWLVNVVIFYFYLFFIRLELIQEVEKVECDY